MIVTYSDKYYDDIVEICTEFVNDILSEYGFQLQQDVINNTIESCKKNSLLYIKDDRCVGVIAGILCTSFTDSGLTFNETIWYTLKEYRKYGIKLYRHLEKWCKENGIKRIVMALMCNSKQDKIDKFYKRLGYKPFEVQYYKQI